MIEDKIWSENPNKFIVGADEVGRGSFAGPICAAAVKINYSHLELLINVKYSKKLKDFQVKYLIWKFLSFFDYFRFRSSGRNENMGVFPTTYK